MKKLFSGLLVLCCMAIATGTADALIVDPTPVTFFTSGVMPAPATLRIEILVTPAAGGPPALPGVQFDIAVPAGPVGTWGPVVLAAIAGSPLVVPGAISSAGSSVTMPIAAVAGTRIGIRAISTTTALLPAIPAMPALSALATPWPAAPAQLVPPGGSNFNTSAPLAAAPTSILGTHFLAVPPFLAGSSPDDPFIGFSTKPIGIPTLGHGGQLFLILLLASAGLLILRYKRRPANL